MDPSDRDPLDTIIKLEFDRDLADVKPIQVGTGPLPDGWQATASGIWPDPYLGPELAFDGDPATRWVQNRVPPRDGWHSTWANR